MTASADRGSVGTSQRKRTVAAHAPTACASKNTGTSCGRIPANVFVAILASVTAGFAKEVEAVNQYAAVMYAPTANGTASDRRFAQPQITARRPKVAITSLSA